MHAESFYIKFQIHLIALLKLAFLFIMHLLPFPECDFKDYYIFTGVFMSVPFHDMPLHNLFTYLRVCMSVCVCVRSCMYLCVRAFVSECACVLVYVFVSVSMYL